MTTYEGVRVPNPLRARCIRSVFEASPLEDVAFAVAEATEFQSRIYVERRGGLWRWSLVHAGGGYPLLRISAKYLHMDYQAIFVGFRTVAEGVSILTDDPESPWEPDEWTVLAFDGAASSDDVTARITAAFQLAGA
jgi:hypothetical protein